MSTIFLILVRFQISSLLMRKLMFASSLEAQQKKRRDALKELQPNFSAISSKDVSNTYTLFFASRQLELLFETESETSHRS